MILLAFFFPLAVYLLVLGLVNRRRQPLVVGGVWDGVGLVFGASGFLLFAGPAAFTGLSERWRLFWLLGRDDLPAGGPDGARQFWVFLAVLYFLAVVGGAALYFWRQRHLTAVYNADVAVVEAALEEACDRLGLRAVRSGGLFYFGQTFSPAGASPAGIRLAPDPAVPSAVLEVEGFALMRHVTLRWDPADVPLRRLVEAELARCLEDAPPADGLLGGWLLTLGFLLMIFELAGAFLVIWVNLWLR